MSFETFVVVSLLVAVAVVGLLLGYAIVKEDTKPVSRSKENFRKDELAQELQRRIDCELELRSGEVKDRVEQELQLRIDCELELRSDEVEARVEQELIERFISEMQKRSSEVRNRVEQDLQSRVDREIERRSGEVGERVKQELQNRVSRKVKERSAEVERRVEQELQSRVDREIERRSGEVGERVKQELQNRVSRKVKERSAEVEKRVEQELQSRVEREIERRSGEVGERVEQELQNRDSRKVKERIELIDEALKAIHNRADLSSQQQSEASNTSEDSDVVEFDPHAPLKQKGTRSGLPYFNRTLTYDEAREYVSRGDFYYFADNKSSEGHLFVGKYLAAIRHYQDRDYQGQLVEREYVAPAFGGIHPAYYALLLFLHMERGTNIDSYPVPKDARDWSGWDWGVQLNEIISLPMRKACAVTPKSKSQY